METSPYCSPRCTARRARSGSDSTAATLTPAAASMARTRSRERALWSRSTTAMGRPRAAPSPKMRTIRAPLASGKVNIPYKQAVDWICEGMAPLGEEYVAVLRRGCLEERWVDIYPNKGKRLGAFSFGGPGTHPFVMKSYNDGLFSASRLAHELGHSLHSYLSWQTQPLIYARYTLFAAEVASNFNQAMVRDYLLRTQTDRAFQGGVIEEAGDAPGFPFVLVVHPISARVQLPHVRRPLVADPLAPPSVLVVCARNSVALGRTPSPAVPTIRPL